MTGQGGGHPRTPGFGEHLDDVLSAYVDDELAPAARRETEAHLAGCSQCRDELDDIAAARRAIRILPVHAAPWPLLAAGPWSPGSAAAAGGAASPRRRAVWALAAAVAAAIAVVLPQDPEVAPSLPSLADSHAARASVTGDPLTHLAPIAVPVGFGP